MGLKHICVAATTVALASSSSTAAATKVDGAAFLETFDDGLKGWVKSEVEQYTGAFVRSFNFFSRRREYDRMGGFVSSSLSLSLGGAPPPPPAAAALEREGRECANFRSGKIEKKRDLAGKKNQSRQSARESLPPHLSRKLAQRRENEKEMRTRVLGGSLCAARELVYRTVSLSLLPFTHTSVFLCFLLFFSLCRRG